MTLKMVHIKNKQKNFKKRKQIQKVEKHQYKFILQNFS